MQTAVWHHPARRVASEKDGCRVNVVDDKRWGQQIKTLKDCNSSSVCQTLFYVLFLPLCFLCSAAGLDASNQASTHELTIPNDVSVFVISSKMSSCGYFLVPWHGFILNFYAKWKTDTASFSDYNRQECEDLVADTVTFTQQFLSFWTLCAKLSLPVHVTLI